LFLSECFENDGGNIDKMWFIKFY